MMTDEQRTRGGLFPLLILGISDRCTDFSPEIKLVFSALFEALCDELDGRNNFFNEDL